MTAGDVLVLRALGLGDALTGVAALRGVRRAWPDRRLVLAAPAGTGGWLRDLGVVDAVLPTTGLDRLGPPDGDPERGGYPDRGGDPARGHVAVNLHGRGPQSHRLLLATRPDRLVAFASPQAGHLDGPHWRADEHEVDRWCRLVRWAGGACGREDLRLTVPRPDGHGRDGNGAVVLHPGAASGSRRWPAERWSWLAARLSVAGVPVLVTGSAAETGLCEQVVAGAGGHAPPDPVVPGRRPAAGTVRSVAGALDLPGLASLVAGARVVVCGDTGVAHLATAVGTPSVLLFGPTPPSWWGPALDAERHTVLWHGNGVGDPHADTVDLALAAITPAEVWEAVEALLRQCG